MKRLDFAILWLTAKVLRWRFPVCLVHVTTINRSWVDSRGEEQANVSNHTRAYSRTNSNVVRHHLEGLLDSVEALNTKVEISDLIHDVETTTPESAP